MLHVQHFLILTCLLLPICRHNPVILQVIFSQCFWYLPSRHQSKSQLPIWSDDCNDFTLSRGDCLEVRRANNHNCSVLCCVVYIAADLGKYLGALSSIPIPSLYYIPPPFCPTSPSSPASLLLHVDPLKSNYRVRECCKLPQWGLGRASARI